MPSFHPETLREGQNSAQGGGSPLLGPGLACLNPQGLNPARTLQISPRRCPLALHTLGAPSEAGWRCPSWVSLAALISAALIAQGLF